MESKFVKAYCSRTNQYFALEVKKVGASWKVTNFIQLSAADASKLSSEVEQPVFETNSNLIACAKCGSRKVGGCSCARRVNQCAPNMKYHFNCIYCDNLKIDYSLPTGIGGQAEGQTVTLSQGQVVKIRLANNRPVQQINVGIGWDPVLQGDNMDVDSSVILLDPHNYNRDLIYFGDLEHPTGCVIHHGDNLTGEDEGQGDDENITVNLNKVPADRDKLLFVLNIYECVSRKQTLKRIKNLYIKLYDPVSRRALFEYRVDKHGQDGGDTAIVIGMAFRQQGEWSFKAIGKSLRVDDLNELVDVCDKYV